jgi:hypothetical protein
MLTRNLDTESLLVGPSPRAPVGLVIDAEHSVDRDGVEGRGGEDQQGGVRGGNARLALAQGLEAPKLAEVRVLEVGDIGAQQGIAGGRKSTYELESPRIDSSRHTYALMPVLVEKGMVSRTAEAGPVT